MSTTLDGTVNFTSGLHMFSGAVDGPTVTIKPEAVLFNSPINDGSGNHGHALWVSGGTYNITNSGVVSTTSIFDEVAAGIFADADTAGTKITNKAEGTISSYACGVLMNAGGTLTNAGLISGFQAIYGYSFGHAYAFTVNNSGIIASIDSAGFASGADFAVRLTGDGKLLLANAAAGQIFGDVQLDGSGTVKNDGFIDGNVTMVGNAGNTVSFANKGFITGDGVYAVTLSAGLKHVASNAASGTIDGGVQFSLGDALYTGTFKNDGTVEGDVAFDGLNGQMTFTNKGSVTGLVSSAGQKVSLTNSGTINSVILAGGDDIVKNTGIITTDVHLGEGKDQFFGGSKQSDHVTDEGGADIYKFGGKSDVFVAVGSNSNNGDDTVDGGANSGTIPSLGVYGDLYDASASFSNLRINLDTVAVISLTNGLASSTLLAAGTATDNGIGPDFGLDYIKNFEMAYGGSGNDIIIGNASANRIEGNGGADELWGGKGNDSLDGGGAGDFLYGGLGRDELRGGDSSTDFFIYKSVAESTLALTGRDMIMDFTTGEDEIDLRQLSLVNFNLIAASSSFTSGDGDAEGKVIQTNVGWTFLMDSNDDGKVDFAIDIFDQAHTNAPVLGDFEV
ncbi:MAG: M10 family metallopeptidase C-terminal domain-containing protein [Hyphomicrobiales bacterium]